MRVLKTVIPTPEQLRVIQNPRPGILVVRGAAGTGKTTTALHRLHFLIGFWVNRYLREGRTGVIRVLVLTYNRTLRGYIKALAATQVGGIANVDLTIKTFSKWATTRLPNEAIVDGGDARAKLVSFARALPLEPSFARDEVGYVRGRFPLDSLDTYITARRDYRGKSPRVDQALRQRILTEVITPYEQWKQQLGEMDWEDLADSLARTRVGDPYDIVIVDEAQDFSANQVRAVLNHVAPEHSVTFVLDAAQRIYPQGFAWSELGIAVTPANSIKLTRNHRNTIEIAAFARPLVDGLELSDDGALPDFSSSIEHGPKPVVLSGAYGRQVTYALDFISLYVNTAEESVAFLHAKGGGWFDHLRSQLAARGMGYVEIAREDEWPEGPENIALSTMHSGKGLEFDHVIILGLNADTTPHGSEQDDSQLEALRRLLAMAIGRARKSVTIGFKPGNASKLIDYLDPATYSRVDL